jgi:hypothetical protein
MQKKIIVGLVAAMLLVGTVGAFAAGETKSTKFPWMASYDNPGQFNIYGSVGLYFPGIDINVGPEIMLTKFDAGGVPLELGVTVRGLVGFASWAGLTWTDWSVVPMVTLHWGVDFGGLAKFSVYIGLGAGVTGTTGTYLGYSAVGFAFADAEGIEWHFSNNISLLFDYCYAGYVSAAGIGVKIAL